MSLDKKQSKVWKHGTKEIKNGNLFGKCKRCGDLIKCSHGSTSSLCRHLMTKHSIDANGTELKLNLSQDLSLDCSISALPANANVPTSPLRKYFAFGKSMEEIVSSLVIDGVTIRAITRNSFFREALVMKGFKLPNHERDVMGLVHNDLENKKNS